MRIITSFLTLFLLAFSLSLNLGRELPDDRLTACLSASNDPKEAEESAEYPILLSDSLKREEALSWAKGVMVKLSLEEKVGQLFIYTLSPIDTKQNRTLLHDAVSVYKVGGLLFSGGKLENQVSLTNRAQKQASIPLMITFDGEWGLSMRLRGMPVFPKNATLGCIKDNDLIYEYGREMAKQCKAIGVQVNFAPVADVNINPKNPVIGTRSFGKDPVRVSDKVIAYSRGLETGGILSVCKHFPGHGDTDIDSHKALPIIPFSRERLNHVELYPFKKAIHAGVSGMMVGHLQVPVIEPVGDLPSSLSRNVVYNLLTEELAFKGLIFTDALAMRGVSGNAHVCLQALKAGNDMVLAPRNLKGELQAVVKAVRNKEISEDEIDAKCLKVLTYKYALGLNKKPHINLSGLEYRINTPQTRDLIRRLKLAAVTVVKNENSVLPLFAETKKRIALIEVADERELDPFSEQLSRYVTVERFRLRPNLSETESRQLMDSLDGFQRIVVGISQLRLLPYREFFAKLTTTSPVIYSFFVPDKMIIQMQRGASKASAVVLAHSGSSDVQSHVADVLFGKTVVDGRLASDVGGLYRLGDGVTITPETPLHFIPEEYGLSSDILNRIDSLAVNGIIHEAYPGCQVLVMKDGHVMYKKAFGTHDGNGSQLVKMTDCYDLASLSKVTGTLLALMKLYDKGRFSLTDKVSTYLPFLRHTNKQNLTIQELLYHQSGLPSSLLFYTRAIDEKSYSGRLFAPRLDAKHPIRIGSRTWGNPRFRFDPTMISTFKHGDFIWQITDSLWLNQSFKKVMEDVVVKAPIQSKAYRYSDVGFVLLKWVVEALAGMSMDEYLEKEFYKPMWLNRTGYLPLRRLSKNEIVPSSIDGFLRKTVLDGFAHDEAAAFQGGVSGNAGLFSTAEEVASIFQMILNGGEWNGKHYLSKETCELFTTSVSKISRRGLGFDHPDRSNPEKGPCAIGVPTTVFGHTGFTGTCAWADPENQLVYVFLSNRIYPNVTNYKLMSLKIREQIQQTIYDALIDK